MPEDRKATDGNHGLRPKLGFLPQTSSQSAAEDYHFHLRMVFSAKQATEIMWAAGSSKLEASGCSILIEHANGIKRQGLQVHSAELGCFCQNIVGNSHNVASATGSLEDVQDLANAGPEQFGRGHRRD